MKTITTPAENREHFIELLRKFHSAMLVTATGTGELHARPMALAEVSEDVRVWFITASDSPKTYEIENDAHVSITAQDGDSCFVALSGRAELVRDAAKVKQLWREEFRAWFPGGPTDPTVELIAVTPARGEYWDSRGLRRVSYLWEATKAYFTHITPEIREGEQHGSVALR